MCTCTCQASPRDAGPSYTLSSIRHRPMHSRARTVQLSPQLLSHRSPASSPASSTSHSHERFGPAQERVHHGRGRLSAAAASDSADGFQG